MTLPFADARILADGARALALETGKALSIAVVDYGGFVVLVERMDGARPMTPSIALSKAYSAAVMQRPTSMLENWRNSDPVFFIQVGRMGQHPIVATKGRVHAQAGRGDRGRPRDLRRQPGRGPEDLRGRAAVGRVRPGLPRVGRDRVPAAALSSLFRDGGCDG